MEYREWGGYIVYEDGSIYKKSDNCRIKLRLNPKGYHVVSVKYDGKFHTMGAHRVVAFAWHGKPPNDGKYYEVDHIDFDRTNNHKDNLQWLTKSENNQRTWDAGHKDNNGVLNGGCKTNEETVKEICELLQSGKMPSEIRDMGYDYNIVRSVRGRKNWKWLSKDYDW